MFAQTDDQQVFERTSVRFMETHYPVEHVREMARAESVFEPERWTQGAELGWTTLLVPESAGGGSISGNGLADLIIVASLFGQHAAPGPLIGTNVVAAALGRWGSAEQHAGELAQLLDGSAVASWGHRSSCRAELGPDGLVLTGTVASVESASDSRYLLVTADEAAGRSHVLVPLDAPGLSLRPLNGVDLTRRFGDVTLDEVVVPLTARVGEVGAATTHDEDLLDLAAVLALAEMAGTLHRAFAMTLEWVANRYSFGRPLNSYQEIKHRMADLRTQVEAAEALASRAASLVGTGSADGRDLGQRRHGPRRSPRTRGDPGLHPAPRRDRRHRSTATSTCSSAGRRSTPTCTARRRRSHADWVSSSSPKEPPHEHHRPRPARR